MGSAQLVILIVTDDIKQGGAIGLQAKYGNMKLVEGFKKVKEESARQLIRPIEEAAAKKKGIANLKSEIIYNDKGKSVIELVTEYAKQNDIDLIVIGSRHQSKFRRLLIGSITYGVISHSSCPVLVVRYAVLHNL